jgi:hypothetical protein
MIYVTLFLQDKKEVIKMNNDKLLLELFGRVQDLEQKVHYLENSGVSQSGSLDEDEISDDLDGGIKITRKVSREYAMKQLKENNPSFNVSKGNRAAKADIIFTKTEREITYSLKAKFYHSKSFLEHVSGWHTVSTTDVQNEDIHMYIFNIGYEGEFYTFLFSRTELLSFIKGKTTGQSNTYHFYFQIVNGKAIEIRDEERDASKFLNNWKLPSEILK